jgi:hypothetical protein
MCLFRPNQDTTDNSNEQENVPAPDKMTDACEEG